MMPSPSDEMRERNVEIRIGDRRLAGTLALPRAPKGMVLFAHGSGSGRSSPRNQLVARTPSGRVRDSTHRFARRTGIFPRGQRV